MYGISHRILRQNWYTNLVSLVIVWCMSPAGCVWLSTVTDVRIDTSDIVPFEFKSGSFAPSV